MPFARDADARLERWFWHPARKPLILRGARQTGKTTAVRRLATHAPRFIELNLERPRDLALVRSCGSATALLERIEQEQNLSALEGNTLLFLDEIQEHPDAVKWLRFLFEDHPELAVIAAGSLLEVRLREEALTFPVGRVEFLRIEPLTFLEFLSATNDQRLRDDLHAAHVLSGAVDDGLHRLAMERFRRFLLVGGLPEAVDTWRASQSLVEVRRVHDALHQAYREDLLKYRPGGTIRFLELVLSNAPAHYGARFKVRNLAPGERDKPVTEALELLERAMVLHRVTPTSARELPLVARRAAARKLVPLDIGLALTQLGMQPERLEGNAVETLLDGRVAEAFAGIQLLTAHPERLRSLSFWTREGSAKSNAEVDYLVPTTEGVLPVEVKSGAAGSLKSLHQYLDGSETDLGIRLSCSAGSEEALGVTLQSGEALRYRLRSMPLYLAELIPRQRADVA